uniref:Uncharacterized protein n=1 Tax=Anopheles farauti TaxID=69004 RepID=A0A182Q232_9DIPT
MEVLDCPLLSVNVRVWRFWSFVLVHNWRRYISIIPVTVLNVFMFADLYRAWGNIEEVIINAYFAVLYFNAVLRTLILVYNRERYESFLAGAATVYEEIRGLNDEVIAKLVSTYTRRARFLSISNLALGAFISGCFVVYPLFTGQRGLPYGMFIPGVNNFDTPQYEIFYITQLVLTFPGCCMYIPYTSFFASSTLFGLVQIKTLQHQLRNFRSEDLREKSAALHRKLQKLIEDHKRIIRWKWSVEVSMREMLNRGLRFSCRYVQELNDLVTYICLIEFLSFGLMLCALLFLLNIISVMAQIVIVGAYIFMILTQIFAFYWHSNEVREESMAIAEAAYSGPWLNVDNAIKKKLLLITIRAQRPLEVPLLLHRTVERVGVLSGRDFPLYTTSTMEALDCPLLSVNVRVWRFWSFILVHNWKRYIAIFPVTVLNVFMFADLYRAWGNFEQVIINAYFAVLYFNAVTTKDETIQKLVKKYTKRARMLSFSNLVLGTVISCCFLTFPLFTGQRRLPYGMYIPGVNSFDSPQYELLYLTQAILTPIGCCMHVPYTSFFASSTLFGLVQIKTLQHQLRNFRSDTANGGMRARKRALQKLVENHLRIIAYVKEINDLVTYICLVEFASFGMILCALLFLLNVIDDTAQAAIIVAYIFAMLSQIFAFYWHSHEVREESMKIAEAAYSGPWVGAENFIKKQLLLIIIRAQRPLEITVGNLYPMTLEMFQSLLSASYSYFTILRRFYN